MKFKIFSIIVGLFMTIVSFQNCAVVSGDQEHEINQASANADADMLRNKAMGVLNSKCASCHNANNAQGGINYITDLNLLLYYKLVKPGDAQHSDIYDVIQSGSMPPGKPLSQSEAKIIFDWIQDGFKNNVPAPQPVVTCTVLEPKWNCIKTLIVERRCATCHTSQSLGGVNLSTYNNVKNVVTAGLPNSSSLYTAVANDGMPSSGTKLTTAEKNAIRTWIENGALNN